MQKRVLSASQAPLIFFVRIIFNAAFLKKKKDGMIILAKSDIEKGFVNIRQDVFKTAYASFWIELLNFYLEENKSQVDLYDLLLFSLEALNSDTISKEVLNLLFQIKFMGIAGFSPNIENCDKCQTFIDDFEQKNIRFDFKEGEIICKNCLSKSTKHGMIISKGTLKQLFWIKNSDIKKAGRIKFSSYAIKEGGILLEAFIPFHIGRDFKSLKFLRKIRNKTKHEY